MLRRSDVIERLNTTEAEQRMLKDVQELAEYLGYKVFRNSEGWFLGEQTSIMPDAYDVHGETYPRLQDLKNYVWSLKREQDERVDSLAERRYWESQVEQVLPEDNYEEKQNEVIRGD